MNVKTQIARPSDTILEPGADHAHAQHLTKVERDRTSPNVRRRDAATLILLDHAGATPKVLMGRRHHGHKFMPGKFVFPGGRIEAADRRMTAANALSARVEEKLTARRVRPSASRPRALAMAAIRETFEETGLLLGSKDYGTPDNPPPGAWTDFAKHGVFPDLGDVRFIARAITPPRRPKRFDTSFFSMDATSIAARVEGVVTADTELVELVWVPLAEAKDLDLPHITRVVLQELDTRLENGMGDDLPVPFYYEKSRKWFREEL